MCEKPFQFLKERFTLQCIIISAKKQHPPNISRSDFVIRTEASSYIDLDHKLLTIES